MTVCETKLSPEINLAMLGYTITRRDRNKQGGGVLIICKSEINHYPLNVTTDSFESVGLKLKNEPSMYSVYAPPKTKISTQDLDKIFSTSATVVAMGDLNSHHTSWGYYNNNANGNTLFKYSIDHPVIIADPKKVTTRHYSKNSRDSIIDLALI